MGKMIEFYHHQVKNKQSDWFFQVLKRDKISPFIPENVKEEVLGLCLESFTLTELCQVLEFDVKNEVLTEEWSKTVLEKVVMMDHLFIMEYDKIVPIQKTKGRRK